MPHLSENCSRLRLETRNVTTVNELRSHCGGSVPLVCVMWLPAGRKDEDAERSGTALADLAQSASTLHQDSVVCVLTTPPDAARLVPRLEGLLRFQLWVAVKTKCDIGASSSGTLPKRHAALLVYSRYKGSLIHTKTRVAYSYCPACGRTTKDYGGKKHLYHEYGTLLSDVWRDIDCDPESDIGAVTDRLRDLFGLEPYHTLRLLDLRDCRELQPARATAAVADGTLQFAEPDEVIPVGSRLRQGDCLEELAKLPDNSVDLCFADPPYNLNKKYDQWDDSLEFTVYFSWCDRWLSELARVLKPGRTLAVINIPLWAARHYKHLCGILRFQDWIAWDGLGFPVRLIMPAHYAVLCFSKGDPRPLPGLALDREPRLNHDALRPLTDGFCTRPACIAARRFTRTEDTAPVSDLWADIFRLKHNSRRVDHPCQLPPKLMRRLFALYTEPGELVLDCFDGAGTSTLVARQMGRRFYGIELSDVYHRIAMQRHKQVAAGEDPFGKRTTVPTCKNSPVERLPKQKYLVSKKVLQLDVRRIAQRLGHLPSRDEVREHSGYPVEMFERYFVSWGEVCAAARTTGMSEYPITADEHDEQQVLAFDRPSRHRATDHQRKP